MKDYNSQEARQERSNQEDPIIMYLIVRESLGMSAGKIAAQCAHASQMLTLKYFEKKNTPYNTFGIPHTTSPEGILVENIALVKQINLFDKWLDSSFRKVVLRADDKEWDKIKSECPHNVLVVDAGLTEIAPNSETVIGLYPMYKSTAPKIIKKLQTLK